jgi:DNA-binding response OmpR family regulator
MKKRILVVDDEKKLTELLVQRLKANGYDAVGVYNGLEALTEIKKNRPDLIILDLGMPDMDGYTMVKELHREERNQSIPILVMTARKRMRELMEVEGIGDFLTKPFASGELLSRVEWNLKRAEK